MRKTFAISLALIILCTFAADWTKAEERFPSPKGYVNDYAGVLSENVRLQLENLISAVEKKTSAEVAVLTVKTTLPLTIEQYAVELFQQWGVGKKGSDNGVLVLVATDDRKVRIEVGYGLEGAITDLHSKLIINDIMLPAFKQGNFDGGISGAVIAVGKLIGDEYGVDLDLKKEAGKLPIAYSGKSRGSPLSGLVTLIFFILIFGFRFGTLFFIMSGRGRYWSSGAYGSFGGGSGGFGGGFGGFGGGLSGGGGASGSW